MAVLKCPQADGKIKNASVFHIYKDKDDRIAKGDLLVRLETSEGMIDIESPMDGTITNIIADARKVVSAGDVIMEVKEAGNVADVKEVKTVKREPPKGQKDMSAVIPVLMPQAGQSVEEATIVKWRVGVGSVIKKGEIIFDIETDKATIEVEAIDDGKIAKIVAPEGELIKVLTPVAYLAESDTDVDAYLKSQETSAPAEAAKEIKEVSAGESKPAVAATPISVSEEGRVKASPAARRIAGEKGIDLSKISTGSGPCGRILSTDIPATAVPSAKPAPAISKDVVRKKMSGMRKAIAKNLLASKQNIPHFYMQMTFNAEPMYSCYQTEKQKYPCSLNDLVTLACGRTIREFPAFRSKIDGDDIVEYPSANIGIAVGMDDGLVVPVIVGVDSMTLAELAAESKRIVTTARGGKTENMGKGVFTITNLGMFGVESFSAIINPSEASILAVGALREDIIVKDGAIRAGKVMTMTISADHRLIDGLLAAKFMARLKELLENPSSML